MKLELKHLAPYLPYGLSIKWFRSDDNSFHTSTLTMSDYPFYSKKLFKPILRPIKDLIKNEFKSELGLWEEGFVFDLDVIEYGFISSLLKLHFDVFGLIEKGLAIDKNTVPNNE